MGLGLKGDRVANTPTWVFPPSLGGSTVGDHSSRIARENCHSSQIWENSSSPITAWGFRYLGSKIIRPFSSSTSPLCLGISEFFH